MPKDTEILGRAIADREYSECLEYIWLDAEDITSKSERMFADDMEKLFKQYPYIGERFEFEKSWDSMFYYLSEKRRKNGYTEPFDIWGNALFGENAINNEASTCQGMKFRYTEFRSLANIIEAIDKVNFEDFEKITLHEVTYGNHYSADSCWKILESWKQFLIKGHKNQCHIVCFSN